MEVSPKTVVGRFGTVVELSPGGAAMVTNHLEPRFLGMCMWAIDTCIDRHGGC